ncbi:MAG: TlpA disulfide reductase family protein [Solirubrobacteraceae bacterium]
MKRRLGPIVTVLVGAALVATLVYGLTKQGTSRRLDAAIEAGHQPSAPNAAKALPVLDGVDGRSAALTHWRGGVVVVNFWASWCSTCNAEAGLLERAQRRLAARHEGTVVGITYKDITGNSLGAIKRFGFTFPNLRDIDGSYAESYGTAQLPETFVLNRQLRVVAISRGEITKLSWLTAAIQQAART